MATGTAPVDALTEEEKERCRYHLGYLETSSAASLQLGIPKALQTSFLVENSLTLLTNGYAVNRVRCILRTLDTIECKLTGALDSLAAKEIGEISLHPLSGSGRLFSDSLEGEYRRWAGRLADILGAPLYPFSARFKKGGPGSILPVH